MTLLCKSMQHLIRHLQRELMVGTDDTVIEEQLLSELTRQEYRANGRDPSEAVTDLRAMRDDILILLHRMPLAERSPTVSSTKVARGQWKLRLTRALAVGRAGPDQSRAIGDRSVIVKSQRQSSGPAPFRLDLESLSRVTFMRFVLPST